MERASCNLRTRVARLDLRGTVCTVRILRDILSPRSDLLSGKLVPPLQTVAVLICEMVIIRPIPQGS